MASAYPVTLAVKLSQSCLSSLVVAVVFTRERGDLFAGCFHTGVIGSPLKQTIPVDQHQIV